MQVKLAYDEDTVLQKHLEAFYAARRKYQPTEDIEKASAFEFLGGVARAAYEAGWVESPEGTADGVGDMPYKQVRAVAMAANQLVSDVVLIDPNE